jgi:hypothetical protein
MSDYDESLSIEDEIIFITLQIKEIEESEDPDWDKIDVLQNELIALENSTQE